MNDPGLDELESFYEALREHAQYMTSMCEDDGLYADCCTCCRLQFEAEKARRRLEAAGRDPEPMRFGTASSARKDVEGVVSA